MNWTINIILETNITIVGECKNCLCQYCLAPYAFLSTRWRHIVARPSFVSQLYKAAYWISSSTKLKLINKRIKRLLSTHKNSHKNEVSTGFQTRWALIVLCIIYLIHFLNSKTCSFDPFLKNKNRWILLWWLLRKCWPEKIRIKRKMN